MAWITYSRQNSRVYKYIILIYYMAWITYSRQNSRVISIYHPYLLYGMDCVQQTEQQGDINLSSLLLYGMDYVQQIERQGDQYIILIYYMAWNTYSRQNSRVISVYHPYLLYGMDYVYQIERQGDSSISSLSVIWHGLRLLVRTVG